MKFFTKFAFFLFAVTGYLNGYTQESIRVQVSSKDNGSPVELIYVNVYQGAPEKRMGTAVTDDSGYATIAFDAYPAVVEVVGVGYEMERITLNQKPQKDLQLKIAKSFSSLSEVVVTGVSKPVKPLDALSNYKVITAAQMQAQGAVNVQDAIAYQLNTVTANDGILGATIQMQGMDGNKVKILMDGVPINGREAGNIDLGQLNVYNLEKIEMIQGPMSVMYGTDALGGVINLISKNTKKNLALSGEAYYESVGKYNYNLSATKSFGKHSFTLGGGRNYFDGYGKTAGDTAAYGPHRTSAFKPKEQYLGNFNYSFRHSDKLIIRFASDFLKEKVINKGVADINSFRGIASDDYYRNTRSINRLTAEGKTGGGQGRYQLINGYTYYHRTKNTYSRNLVTLNQDLTPVENLQDTTTFNEFSFRGMYDNILLKKLNYTVGYDVDLQSGNSQKIPGGTRSLNDYAAFTTVSLPLFDDKFKIQGGLRASYNTAYTSPLIPSLNLLYKATPSVSIRASYAKGFRAPSLKELYLDFQDVNHMVFGNPNLKAEKGDHIQASASWLVYEKKTNYAQILFTTYYNNVYNQIMLVQRDPSKPASLEHDYVNVYKMRNSINTLEFEGQYSNFHYKLGYSYSYTFAQEGINNAFDAQEFTTTLQYLWKWSKLNFSVFNKLNGARPRLTPSIDGSPSYSGKQPVYDMMDISVSRKFWKQNIQITAGVKNVFDVVGFNTGGVTSSAHSGDGTVSFLPRSVFTSLRINLD